MIDEETRARIAGMKRAGITNKAIAVRLGLTQVQVQGYAKRTGAYQRLDHGKGKKETLNPAEFPFISKGNNSMIDVTPKALGRGKGGPVHRQVIERK